MFSSSSSKFDLLPARPPTPPKELSNAVDDAIAFLDDSNEIDRLLNRPQTAHDAIASTTEFSPASCRGTESVSNASKRVGFSSHPVYYKIAREDQSISPNAEILKRSPLTKSAKPLKSILKPADALAPLTPEDLDSKLSVFSPEIPGSFAKMLQSVIQQLAGPSRSSRLDAYLALNGVFQAYESVPDIAAMAQKMSLIMQFLTRDMAWKDADGRLDVNIITQALKLTVAILFDSKLAEALDDDFKTFLIDRSIAVLEQSEMPKAVVKTHLYVLAQQHFRGHIMTGGRVDKLLTALQTIEDRCSGNSVVASRLVVYKRLFEQAPGVMLNKIGDWLEHVFHGMLSSVKDVRTRAIETCTQAGLVFGQQPHAGKALQELFDTEVEEGQTYCDYLTLRLGEMMGEKDFGAYVPQIWSSVILFFRSKRMPLGKWPMFKPWLQIIQKCLNSSDIMIRYQALLAWNKLVFAIMPDSSILDSHMSMLKVPICSGMEKKGADKYSQQVRQYAFDSYYNLLHYALRPGLSNEEHDIAWDLFVDPVLSGIAKSSGRGRYTACRVLHGLINGNAGVWNGNSANEQTPIKPEELPKLDPRWVRSRLGKIFKLLEPLIATGMWSSPEANAALDAIWHNLMQSVADAGSQEVRTSNDLKQAIVLAVNMFRRLWYGCDQEHTGADKNRWLDRYVSLVETMVASLGAAPFVEDILCTTDEDVIEVAPTPSLRHSKSHGTPQSPLVVLFGLFCFPPNAMVVGEAYQNAAFTIVKRLSSSKSSFQLRLEILNRSMRTWSRAPSVSSQPSVKEHLWFALARNAMLVLKPEASLSDGQESQGLGHGFRNAVDMLVAGLEVAESAEAGNVMEDLYDAIYDTAKTSAGDGGIVLAIMEPFAKALINIAPSVPLKVKLHFASYMLGKAVWPRNRQSLEHARKALWGVGLAPHKTTTFDPFEHVYALIRDLTTCAYNNFDSSDTSKLDLAKSIFSSAIDFLDKSPPSLGGIALRKVQEGFALWFEDNSKKTGADEEISEVIQSLWSRVIHLLEKSPNKDSAFLKALECLLVAGFSSPHEAIVNKMILFWNETFGNEQSLEYPPKLERTLRARVVDADISLPTFPESTEESIPASLPAFYESRSQLPVAHAFPKFVNGLHRDTNHLSPSPSAVKSPYFMARRSPIGQQISVSSPPRRAARTSASLTPKPRFRHDDSQIQFAPIDSSPLPLEGESQLLTEHQKEVKARQHQNAQLFPDLSSSPVARSAALPQVVSKRLNFTSHTIHQHNIEAPGTPSGLPDGLGLMSDDLPSSPTPSSTKDVFPGAVETDEDQEFNDALEDPPSSPPRGSIESADQPTGSNETENIIEAEETTVDVTDFGMAPLEQRVLHDESCVPPHTGVNKPEQDPEIISTASECPSDSQLPNMQLQLEEEAASTLDRKKVGARSIETANSADTPVATRSNTVWHTQHSQSFEAGNPVSELSEGSLENQEQEITRVENSFFEPDAVETEVDSQSNIGSQQSRRSTRKRKRSKQITYPAKKRKQQSPFERFASQVQDQEDEDIGDEIVVASSQRSSSPITDTSHEAISSPSNLVDTASDPMEESVGVVKVEIESTAVGSHPKRGRGRPRKSETPTPSQAEVVPRKNLKRRASTLSNASKSESQISPKAVKSTPPGTKTSGRAKEDENMSTAIPEEQLEAEQAVLTTGRPIATPRSILKRVRDALSDFRGMIMGSQDEREFDDVLFEFRREAHEAGRRARELV